MGKRTRIVAPAVAIAAVGLLWSAGAATAHLGPEPLASGTQERYTPVVQSVFSTPRWFKGADDRFHLVYELVLTNAFPVEVTVTSVEVRDARGTRTGQVLARTGNSGSSTGPHLHFQVMDRPSALVSDGLPYVFEDFDLAGRTPPIDVLIRLDELHAPIPIDAQGAGHRRDELPLGLDVVAFPGA